MWKTPEDIFRYFDTLKATRTGRTVSHVRDRSNHAFRRPLKMGDVAKNPSSLCHFAWLRGKVLDTCYIYGSFRISVSDDYTLFGFLV